MSARAMSFLAFPPHFVILSEAKNPCNWFAPGKIA
jgi:hypothetical protein